MSRLSKFPVSYLDWGSGGGLVVPWQSGKKKEKAHKVG